tara:strand:- start:2053 stop:2715 length:663 start_codon:yes stop_codon:yes gene_type:complete
MKNIFYLIAGSFLLVQLSCGPGIRFEEPQPVGEKQETKFSSKFQGLYASLDDNSKLVISETDIIQTSNQKIKLALEIIDTSEYLKFEDGLLIIDGTTVLPAKLEGDSVTAIYDLKDTIFEISEEQVLKKFKGSYFLNTRESDGLWLVEVLSLDKKGLLTFSLFENGEEDRSEIEDVTPIDSLEDDLGEVTDYVIRPDKKELKELIQSNALQLNSRFQKIQ